MSDYIRISNILTVVQKLGAYIYTIVAVIGFIYYNYISEDIVIGFFFKLALPVGLIQFYFFFKMSTHVYYDRINECIVAYDFADWNKKVGQLDQLWSVSSLFNMVVFKFNDGTKIRFIEKSSSVFEWEDSESFYSSFKKRALKNRGKEKATS